MKTKPVFIRTVAAIYNDLLVNKYKDQNFWILTAFIPTFFIARYIVKYFPGTYLNVGGQHVHHFTYGFLILAVSGYLAIIRPRRSPPWLAFLFGIGLALAIDEAGMWLHLTNYYYNDTSENTVIVTLAILVNIVYFREFWIKVTRAIFQR